MERSVFGMDVQKSLSDFGQAFQVGDRIPDSMLLDAILPARFP